MAADFLDVASDLTLEFNSKSIEAVRGLVPKERELDEDEVVECEECGNIIPHKRARSYSICVDCSRWREDQSKRYGKKFLRDCD